MKIYLIISVLFFTISYEGISQKYEIKAYKSEYKEIENYQSMLDISGGYFFEERFDLDFGFPFFDTIYDHIWIMRSGVCYFDYPEEADFSIRGLEYNYELDDPIDIDSIDSDVRIKYTEINGINVLIVQFTKLRLATDTSIETHDSHLNFQYWIYEDGTFEFKMGNYNLENSPNYIPGDGFYFFPANQTIKLASHIALVNPLNEKEIFSYNDTFGHENYQTSTDSLHSILNIPPPGWVIQFKNKTVSTNKYVNIKKLKLYPNPTYHSIHIEGEINGSLLNLRTLDGHLIQSLSYVPNVLDLSHLHSGVYIIEINNNNRIENHRVVILN